MRKRGHSGVCLRGLGIPEVYSEEGGKTEVCLELAILLATAVPMLLSMGDAITASFRPYMTPQQAYETPKSHKMHAKQPCQSLLARGDICRERRMDLEYLIKE
jgi:hypothetical protein